MTEPAAAAPGWYPVDGERRFWDGQQWTDRTQPAYPVVANTATSVTYVPARTNHVLHLVISVLTLGAWLPFWVTVAVVNQRKYVQQITYGVSSQ